MVNRYSAFLKLAAGLALVLAVLILHPGSWEQRAGARAKSMDPIAGAFFQVDVDGKFTAAFKGCSGIGSTNEVVEYTEAKTGVTQRKPGRLRWSDVTLSRGLTTDLSLYQWRQDVIEGRIAEARKKCTITMFDAAGRPAAIWELANAWPASLIVNQKDSGGPVVEDMTVTYENATRKQ